MSMTDSPIGLTTAVSIVGSFVRYAFYAAGVFVMVALLIVPFLRSDPVKRVDDKPGFRLASAELARLPMTASVITGRGARLEMRQYGRLHDRDKDLTVMMVLLPKGQVGAREFSSEMHDLSPLMSAGASFSNTYYDLQTRFGPVRAREFRVNADGRTKLCLAYLSRFETSSMFLKGWTCEASGIKAGIYDLACNLDSLVIDQTLAFSEADAFLRQKMKRPKECSGEPVTQTTDTRPYRPPVRRY